MRKAELQAESSGSKKIDGNQNPSPKHGLDVAEREFIVTLCPEGLLHFADRQRVVARQQAGLLPTESEIVVKPSKEVLDALMSHPSTLIQDICSDLVEIFLPVFTEQVNKRLTNPLPDNYWKEGLVWLAEPLYHFD